MKKLILLFLLLPFITIAQTKLEYKAASLQIVHESNQGLKFTLDTVVSFSGYFIVDKNYIFTEQYDNLTKTEITFELLSEEREEDYSEVIYTYLIRPSYKTINVIYDLEYPNTVWVSYDVSENISHIIEYEISIISQIRKPRYP